MYNAYSSFLNFVQWFQLQFQFGLWFYGHVKWVPCHHGRARSQVVEGGDGLQIWRVAANILNKQYRTADKGRFSSLGAWRGVDNSSM
jgi:hypothetical protein